MHEMQEPELFFDEEQEEESRQARVEQVLRDVQETYAT